MDSTRQINKVELRNLRMEDYDQLAGSFHRIYADHDVFWTRAQIKKLIDIFPEGQEVIIAEATPNTEMILVADVDLSQLSELHTYGSVRNLRDRRSDLYKIVAK